MKIKKKIEVCFFQSHISRFGQKKGNLPCFFVCHVEFSCLCTGYSIKRAVDHKNSSREIIGKFVIVLIRLTFLFLSFLTLLQRRNVSIIHRNKTRQNNTSSNQVPECYITVGITALSEIKSLSQQKGMCLLFTKTQA